MVGHVGPNTLELDEAARFPNIPVRLWEGDRSALHWNVVELYRNVTDGLGAALRAEPGLAQRRRGCVGCRLRAAAQRRACTASRITTATSGQARAPSSCTPGSAPPSCTARTACSTCRSTPSTSSPSTVGPDVSTDVDSLLLIPDLFTYWLSGERVAERTNASTTGLLTADGEWNTGLIDALDLPRGTVPAGRRSRAPPSAPSLPSLRAELQVGGAGPSVTTVGSHDTASAVVAVPMHAETAAYISCGTWGLVGVELEHPVLTEAARAANFTNEGGVDGRVRFLHNVMGLWLLSESIRTWQAQGLDVELVDLLERAEAYHAIRCRSSMRTTPGSSRPATCPRASPTGAPSTVSPSPRNPVEYVRSIVESLADAFASAVRTAADLSGRTIDTVHIVGGGARNRLLCQLTADRSGLPVLAGPVEATAIGNVLVQARAQGLVNGDLEVAARPRHPRPPARAVRAAAGLGARRPLVASGLDVSERTGGLSSQNLCVTPSELRSPRESTDADTA